MKALVVAAVVLGFSVKAAAAICNTADGNVPDHAGVNYNAVLLGNIGVCLASTSVTQAEVNWGMDAWNGVSHFTLMWPTCSYTGVAVRDDPVGICGSKVACAEFPFGEVTQVLNLYVTASYLGLDDWNKECVMAHELGHTLGFAHSSSDSVMVTPCGYNWPTPLDEANYWAAYWPDPPISLQSFESHGTDGDVIVTWTQRNEAGETLCNEAGFAIHRSPPVVGTFDTVVDELPKDAQASVQLNQGEHADWCYRVTPTTNALPDPQGGRSYVGIDSMPHSQDTDCDAWADVWEDWIGTDAEDACGAGAWPPDMDGNTYIQISDVLYYKGRINRGYSPRLDLYLDNVINVADVLQYPGLLNRHC